MILFNEMSSDLKVTTAKFEIKILNEKLRCCCLQLIQST